MDDDRSAALLIRVWLEGQDDAFRARLTATRLPEDGAPTEEMTVAVTASPRDVVDAVDQWLADFLRGSHRTPGN